MKNHLVILMLALMSTTALASASTAADLKEGSGASPRVIYPKKSVLDFEGLQIQGELRTPGEFYFQRKPEEKFDSLVKRRKNFHREMLRDVVLSR